MNRIVGLYRDPPDDAVILCIDEKTGMQALERKHETRRAIPGRPGRCEYEYIRHGTQSLLAAFDIRTGRVTARCGPTRTAEDLVSLLEAVAEAYREAARIIVIWDNLDIHHDGPQARWSRFNARHGGKFEFVYTPRHASWVNQVEIFFSILQRRCLKHGDFHSAEELRERVLAFIARWNTEEGHPFHWTFRGYPMQERAVA
ncbi:IS630 family transposase [Geochorda subterranea]|uniref:IS630 family transposase n=1 Tax=Geochorda subterranea TaxID=3109564 RepID=A0ABZ1BTU7_9FIRM|nr:IS630 family transposase [Limnochorda sp. LNt]WRP15532.1 IS630 family transposase [Limnochorda sp. LNt]